MSDRVAACGAPRLPVYAAEPRCAPANGASEDAPAEPGPAPDSSRGPSAVADHHHFCHSGAPEAYQCAPDRSEFTVHGAMPTFHYKAASAPPHPSCADYQVSEGSYRIGSDIERERPDVEDASGVNESRRESECSGGRSPGDSSTSERDSRCDEESQNCNGGIDYQFLEQNISHQSILNQSISILNRHVGSVRGNGGAVNSVQQLVRTAEGVLLAVLPAAVEADTSASERSVQQVRTQEAVTVPLGWRRIVSGTSVVYISPSGCALATHAQLRDYLQTPGTCKCGLQCPLRPESAFSFDPKVASKPYQVPPGGDLTKLCNHKRKLLASLQHPVTPPHQLASNNQQEPSRKGMTVEAPLLKKKMKKKTMLQAGVSMSQLLAQRERASRAAVPHEYKGWMPHQEMSPDVVGESRTISPHAMPVRNCSQSCPPAINIASQHMVPSNMAPSDPADQGPKPEVHGNMPGSHYLTVNSGCINQSSPMNPAHRIMPGSYQHNASHLNNPALNMGQPVLGTNGQIIGVHTGVKLDGQLRAQYNQQQMQERSKQEDRYKSETSNQQMVVRQGSKPPSAEDGSQAGQANMNIFCGLNQVPPEVVQKIDQQQQIFIQQNQKQIQMAMKGIRAQATPENPQIKNSYSNQPGQLQGQLVIQNGTVMKANPAKTPPWQVKRSDSSPVPPAPTPPLSSQQQRMQNFIPDHPNNKTYIGDSNQIQANMSQENYQILQNFEQSMSQMANSRVPPLHMSYPPAVYMNESKKKTKVTAAKNKKKITVIEDRNYMYGNNGMRGLQSSKGKPYEFNASNPSPSFMDDPSGYLAQQTALLNNTISRQVSSNITFEGNEPQGIPSGTGHGTSNPNIQSHNVSNQGVSNQGLANQPMAHRGSPVVNQSIQNLSLQNQPQVVQGIQNLQNKALPNQNMSNHGLHHDASNAGMLVHSVTNPVMPSDGKLNKHSRPNEHMQQYKNTMNQHPSPLQNNIPDSSVASEKQVDTGRPPCCKGCTNSANFSNDNPEPTVKMQYMKQQMYQEMTKIESDQFTHHSSPNHSFEDNPVTSSTFIERAGTQGGCVVSDNRGPIQGGTVSTSHVSPPDPPSLPEPSPTPSNSSRSADTPHSNPFPVPSPARSNSTTPSPGLFSSPGPLNNTLNLTGSQMMNFISNHNVNKNLMDVENISFSGANAVVKSSAVGLNRNDQKRMVENGMLLPGYCPPPHLGGGPSHSMTPTGYVQKLVTTMASGHSVIRDTITSVLAGKAQTATTFINAASTNFRRPPQPPNLSHSYAIPPNHPDPFLNSVNLPTSYPLHIAGTITQNIINKTPLEMVQSVVSNIPMSRQEVTTVQSTVVSQSGTRNVHSGQILISSTGQIIMPNQGSTMPPPAPKSQSMSGICPQSSSVGTNVSASVTQVIPAGVSQVINQPTVLVNTLPAPFVLQPQMMTVDGQVVQQNTVLPQIVAGNLVPQGQSSNDSHSGDTKQGHGVIPRVAMLSPESKKKGKKRKSHNLTNVLHIAAPQQSSGSVLLHHASPQHHTSPQFSPRSFQLSPNSMSPAPMLQALTIVPGKSGTPAHILMNGQGCTSSFGSQQIITNTSPTQQINLLQPVNLINNASGVVPNFQTFQQFIVPNIGGMVMTADGTAIIQDSSTGMPMQLQLQNVNGQNVLTPIQNQNVLTTGGNTGVVIRTQNPHGKIIQSQHSPGAQFLSPNSHIMMNSPTFSGQLSPLIANVSPTSVTFNTSPHQVRSTNMQQQELVQCNQMGQAVMVPLSPKPITTTANRSSSTFVQQNTTIVQHQTTLVSNSTSNNMAANIQNVQGSGNRLSIDPTVLFSHNNKQHKSRSISIESQVENIIMPSSSPNINREKVQMNFSQINHNQLENEQNVERQEDPKPPSNQNMMEMSMGDGFNQLLMNNQQQGMFAHVRHSVSTQTLVNQHQSRSPPVAVYSSSPPDTTTHSPLGPLENASSSPRVYSSRSISMQGNYADTTTKSPEPMDSNSSAMVQCVSSSEPDMPEGREGGWLSSPAHPAHPAHPTLVAPTSSADHAAHQATLGMMGPQMPTLGHRNVFCSVESTDTMYNQSISVSSVNNQHSLTITPTNYERNTGKRKNQFADNAYRPDKIVRSNYATVHCELKEMQNSEQIFNKHPVEKSPKQDERRFLQYDSSTDNQNLRKDYDRRNSHDNEPKPEGASAPELAPACKTKEFVAGELVWGPNKGYPSWPGKLVSLEDGRWLVRWFGGDRLLSLLEPRQLQTLSEGLEAHHAARTKCRKSRKLNTHLEKAIQEAMSELDKISTEASGGGEGTRRHSRRNESRLGRPPKNAPQRKNPVKIAPNPGNASGRLRSSR